MTRMLNIYVKDRGGRDLQDATVDVLINGQPLATIHLSAGPSGGPFPEAELSLVAHYPGQKPQTVKLAAEQESWTFTFGNVDQERPIMEFVRNHPAVIIGLLLLLMGITLAFTVADPTDLQRQLILSTIALAAGGIASIIPGMLNVDLKLGPVGNQLAIGAAGALAVFVILFFFVPAGTDPKQGTAPTPSVATKSAG